MKMFNRSINRKYVAGLVAIAILLGSACKPSDFEDSLRTTPSVVLFDYPAQVNAVDVNTITKSLEKIEFPVEISLAEASNATFSVRLVSVPSVAASQSIPNAAVITTPDFSMPESIDVKFGSKKVSFTVSVSNSAIERNYGKNLAFAIQLSNPTKGQSVNEEKKTIVFTINTTDLAAIEELHFLSFTKAITDPSTPVVNELTAANLVANNVTIDNNNIIFQPRVDLGGIPGKGFNTSIIYNRDTIDKLIQKGLVPAGTIQLPEDAFSFENVVMADKESTSAALIRISIDSVFAKYPSKFVVAFTLANPERFQVDKAKSTLVYLIDPLRVIADVTKLYMKNTSQPFKAVSVDPNKGRWGVLADWIMNAQANQHQTYDAANILNGSYGSFDNNNNTQIAFESGFTDANAGKPGGTHTAPNITNGKIYQTVSLLAGTYRFDANARSGIPTDNTKGFYSIAAIGNSIPNIGAPTIPANFLNRVAITGAGIKSLTFTLSAPTTVSLGFVATLTGNQWVNISGVTLTRTVNP